MFGPKIYTVHIHPDHPPPSGNPVFVREGFNIFALLFMALWALYHRLWLLAAILVAAQVSAVWLGQQYVLSPLSAQVMYLGLQVLVGFHANDWRRRRLQKKGYITADVTTGDSQLRAEQRFFERFLATG